MMDLAHLLADGSTQFFISMTERTGGNSADAIQIFLSVGSIEIASLSMADSHSITTVNVQYLQEEKRSNNVVRKASITDSLALPKASPA